MNDIMLIVLVVVGIVGAFVSLGVIMHRRNANRNQDRWQTGAKRAPEAALPTRERGRRDKRVRPRRYTEPLVQRMMRPLSSFWKVGDTSQSHVQELLVHAGIREKGAVEVFLGAKFALALALPVATTAFLMWRAKATGIPMNYRHLFMAGAMGLAFGMILPIMWLRRKANARIDRIRMSLPDALDLLIVCVESGLGLDAALLRITHDMGEVAPELCDELTLLNLEISAGKPRDECLRNLALRSGCEEVEALTARINQAAKYGTNLGNSLRIHSESLRQRRRQEAEERAAKTSVKLIFPLVFCMFPATFVVLLGSAVIQFMQTFGGGP